MLMRNERKGEFAEEQEELLGVNTNFQAITAEDALVSLEAQQSLVCCIIDIKEH